MSKINFREGLIRGMKRPCEVQVFIEEKDAQEYLENQGYRFKSLRSVLKDLNIPEKFWKHELNAHHLSRKVCICNPLEPRIFEQLVEHLEGTLFDKDDTSKFSSELCYCLELYDKFLQLKSGSNEDWMAGAFVKSINGKDTTCLMYSVRIFHNLCCRYSISNMLEKHIYRTIKGI